MPQTVDWQLPDIKNSLDIGPILKVNEELIQQRARLIQETMASFGAPVQVVEINYGPRFTQFSIEPLFLTTRDTHTKVSISKIASLLDDLALVLAVPYIDIQMPVPGHNHVYIEIPNEEIALVTLRELLESETSQNNKNPLRFALGRDMAGHPVITSLHNMPHLLIAGMTGSGKSVCVNAILSCFLMHNTPDDLRLILVDLQRVELGGYNGIPHLLSPVVETFDRVVSALQWTTREIDKRYYMFSQAGAYNIADYNAKMELVGAKKLPFLVIVVEELADLMITPPNNDIEQTLAHLTQHARAVGVHMILVTQRPSVDVVNGLIKSNFPARIAFAVTSQTDSRVILDQSGAEQLLSCGDMLFYTSDMPAPVRLQGVFVSDHEIRKLTDFWRSQATY
jgi:S-DNA-T family DNA segregation ATPase FtsK/SpoIIIE